MIHLKLSWEAMNSFIYQGNDSVSIDENGDFVRADRLYRAKYIIRRRAGYEDEGVYICCKYIRYKDSHHRCFPSPSLKWKLCKISLRDQLWLGKKKPS